jgi:hypothetical protein
MSAIVKSRELLLEVPRQNCRAVRTPHHEHLPGLGQQLQISSTTRGKSLIDRDGGLVLPSGGSRRYRCRRPRKRAACRERAALGTCARIPTRGRDRHDEVRFGPSAKMDRMKSTIAVQVRLQTPSAHDDLNEVHRVPRWSSSTENSW